MNKFCSCSYPISDYNDIYLLETERLMAAISGAIGRYDEATGRIIKGEKQDFVTIGNFVFDLNPAVFYHNPPEKCRLKGSLTYYLSQTSTTNIEWIVVFGNGEIKQAGILPNPFVRGATGVLRDNFIPYLRAVVLENYPYPIC